MRRVAIAVVISNAIGSALPSPAPAASGIHKIRHIVIIMQENRSFDSYFGIYARADGLPRDRRAASPSARPTRSGGPA